MAKQLESNTLSLSHLSVATAEAPVNIAIIKYWGKIDAQYNIPTNDSISISLDLQCMKSVTTITISYEIKEDVFILNKQKQPVNKRMQNVIKMIHEYLSIKPKYHYIVQSENNFPTAAGLASSASGYAALAKAFCILYNINNEKIISQFARVGSGSSTRSIYGGFVKWVTHYDNVHHNNSYSMQLFNEEHWNELRVLILVVSSKQKDVSSSDGQQRSTATSSLFQQRLKNVENRIKMIENSIKNRNFNEFSDICMKDCNEFHSICLNSYPPIFYLNETSKLIIQLVHYINNQYSNYCQKSNQNCVCYTFDAGPNAVLIAKNPYFLNILIQFIFHVFYNNDHSWIYDPLDLLNESRKYQTNENFHENIRNLFPKVVEKSSNVQKIIVTKIGKGAQNVKHDIQCSKL